MPEPEGRGVRVKTPRSAAAASSSDMSELERCRFGGARERGRSEPAAREPSDGERCSMRRIWQRSSGRSRWKSACWNSDQPDWPLAWLNFRLRVLRKP